MQSNTDVQQITSLLQTWAQAVATRNIEGILAHHSPDILMFDVPVVEVRGTEAYRQGWEQMFPWLGEHGKFELRDIEVTAGEDVAFASARVACSGKELQDKGEELDVRLTVGLKKVDGQWVVTHEHHSEVSAD